tara:strand:+ start:9775 stop:10737 length:963 start_codon:yes stop_codon:yes gene_type:complete
MKFTTRAYNSFELNQNNLSSIIKKSKEERLLNEINYYKNLPKNLQIYFPRIVEKNTSITKPYKLEVEYYGYSNLGQQMIYENFDKEEWGRIFDFLFTYIKNYKLEKKRSTKSDIYRMLIEKTEVEYLKLINENRFFKKFSKINKFYFNNKELLNFHEIWEDIKKHIFSLRFDKNFYYIHGDLCFSNILFSKNYQNDDVILKFVDPRGKFGNKDFYGNHYYDLAKLSHSVNGGYEYFIFDEFNLNIESENIDLKFSNDNKNKISKILMNKINLHGYDSNLVSLIEGIIYVGMCARHYDSIERQKAMFVTGVDLLNKVYEKL